MILSMPALSRPHGCQPAAALFLALHASADRATPHSHPILHCPTRFSEQQHSERYVQAQGRCRGPPRPGVAGACLHQRHGSLPGLLPQPLPAQRRNRMRVAGVCPPRAPQPVCACRQDGAWVAWEVDSAPRCLHLLGDDAALATVALATVVP